MSLCLVTGGTGFLGTYLVRRLLQEGHSVRVLDSEAPQMNGAPSLEFIQADIRDKEAVHPACRGASYIFHLAALPSIAHGGYPLYRDINVEGTGNLLTGALACGAQKVIHVSSTTVYGIPSSSPIREEDPIKPVGPYSRSKVEAENLCHEFSGKGLSVSILRPRVIIGPGRLGIFSILFDRVLKNQSIYILGDGKNRFQFTHVSDVAEACWLASQQSSSQIFNIGAEKIQTVRQELTALISHAKSRSRITPVPAWVGRAVLAGAARLGISPLVAEQFSIADRDFWLDTSKAQRLLGWQPTHSNLEALLESFDWYREHRQPMRSQYRGIFNVLGRFEHHRMGAFQKCAAS